MRLNANDPERIVPQVHELRRYDGVLVSKPLPPHLKDAPRWKVLKHQVPDYTCPSIDVVQDFLRDQCIAPPEILKVLEQVRRDNCNLREVAKQAIRELKKWEAGEKTADE